jgi:hypothetical protein
MQKITDLTMKLHPFMKGSSFSVRFQATLGSRLLSREFTVFQSKSKSAVLQLEGVKLCLTIFPL